MESNKVVFWHQHYSVFSMMFSAILKMLLFAGDSNGIKYNYYFDGSLFNLRKLQAKTKIQVKIVLLLLALKLTCNTLVNLFSSACDK